MVDINEYRQQLAERRGTIEQAQKKAQEQRLIFSQQQLRGTQQLQRQQAMQQFQTSKQEALAAIEPELKEQEVLEREFKEYEAQQQEYQKQVQEYEALQQKQQDYDVGYQKGMEVISGKQTASFGVPQTPEGREGYKDALARLEYQQIESEAQVPVSIERESFLALVERAKKEPEVAKLLASYEFSPVELTKPKEKELRTWSEKVSLAIEKVTPFTIPGIGLFGGTTGLIGPKEIIQAKPYVEKVIPFITPSIGLVGPKEISKVKPYVEKVLRPFTYPGLKKGEEKQIPPVIGYKTLMEGKGIPAGISAPTSPGKTKEIPLVISRPISFAKPYVEKAAEKAKKAIPLVIGYPQIDVIGVKPLKDIASAREIEYKELEPKGRRAVEDIKKLGSVTTKKEEQEALTKLREQYGIITIPIYDPKTKKTTYRFEFPDWFRQLRPGFVEKKEKETVVPFFFRKLGSAYEETFGELYQRAVYKGPTLGQPGLPVRLSPVSRVIGKGFGIVGESQFYVVPGVKAVAFLGGPTEAALRGPKAFVRYAKQEPVEVAVAGLYAAGKGYQFYKYAKQPIRLAAEAPPKARPYAIQVIEPSSRGLVTKTKLGMVTIVPGRRYAEVPRYVSWFYNKPIVAGAKGAVIMEPAKLTSLFTTKPYVPKVITTAPKTYTSIATGIAVGKYSSVEVVQQRVGGKQKTLLRLVGKSGTITQKSWAETPKTLKDLIRKTVQKQIGGPLLSDTQLKAYLSRGSLQVSSVPGLKITRLGKYKEPVKLYLETSPKSLGIKGITLPKGKIIETTRMISLTKGKPALAITTPEGLGIGKYKGLTAIGKTKPTFIKEIIIVKGQQGAEYFGVEGIKKLPKFFGVGKRSSEAFFKALYGPETQAAISKAPALGARVGQVSKIKGILAGAVKTIPRSAILPKTTGKVEEGLLVKGISVLAPIVSVKQIPEQLTIVKPALKEEAKPIVKEIVKTIPKTVTKEIPKTIPKEVSKVTTALKPITKPILKPITKPTLKPAAKVAPTPKPSPIAPPFAPIVVPPLLKTEEPTPRKTFAVAPKKVEKYQPFVRRYGKWIPAGKPTTLKIAEEIGLKRVKRTLAASLQIKKVPTGEVVPIGKKTRRFRPGKKEPFVLVQRRGFRLESPFEVREIISARRTKTRKGWIKKWI